MKKIILFRSFLAVILSASFLLTDIPFVYGQEKMVMDEADGIFKKIEESIDITGEGDITSRDGKYQYAIKAVNGVNYAYIYEYEGSEAIVNIPSSLDGYTVRGLGTMIFLNNRAVREVHLPNTISSIAAGAFATAYSLEKISIDKTSATGFHMEGNMLYNGRQLVAYPAAGSGSICKILEGTTAIQAYAFYGCKYLTQVMVPNTAITISNAAFSRSVLALDIVLKHASFGRDNFADGIGWELATDSKVLVKTQELKNQLLSGMKSKDAYKDSTATMAVEIKEVKATNISLSGSDSITLSNGILNYSLSSYYIQAPADTTENVTWRVISGFNYCSVSPSGLLTTKNGGKAVLEAKDESGHTITLNVTIASPVSKFELLITGSPEIEVRDVTYIQPMIEPEGSYAESVGAVWESSDTNVAVIESTDGRCTVKGVSPGFVDITATINDNGNHIEKSVNLRIYDDINTCTIDPIPPQTYTGTQLKPVPIVRYKNRILIEGEDYTISSYGQNNFAGVNAGKIYISGCNTTFSGSDLTASFTVIDGTHKEEPVPQPIPHPVPTPVPQPPSMPVPAPAPSTGDSGSDSKKVTVSKTSIKSVRCKKKKTIDVSWKKNSKVTGYQIQYSTNSKFRGTKTIKVKKYKTTSYTIKKLKSKKTYYVRMRSFKEQTQKTYYSSWSSRKKVKTK